MVRYAHIGTGNYNETTAKNYEDIGIFTNEAELGYDLSDLFNYLTGYSRRTSYRQLAVSPAGIRNRITELIEAEAERGEEGHITMKMNSLVDAGIISSLYEASQAGARIELIVRGICCLKPEVAGLSENITVKSIVGRYLEHSRIYRFGSRGRERHYYIGSADMMERNLDRRVEALTPIFDPDLQFRLDEVIDVLLADDNLSWSLGPDGSWARVAPGEGVDAHVALQDLATARSTALI